MVEALMAPFPLDVGDAPGGGVSQQLTSNRTIGRIACAERKYSVKHPRRGASEIVTPLPCAREPEPGSRFIAARDGSIEDGRDEEAYEL